MVKCMCEAASCTLQIQAALMAALLMGKFLLYTLVHALVLERLQLHMQTS
jgi:hypothetical protein